MHKELLLQKFLSKSLNFIHKKRLQVLMKACNALMSGSSLTLSSLGRYLKGAAKERNQIRKMDRLLGNKHLHKEIPQIYSAINKILFTKGSWAVISVDWSCLSYAEGRYLLRASVSIKGRSMVCYQEVHPKAAENNKDTHDSFLENLANVLPKNIRPIIVTDAIFSVEWFRKVLSLGWNFLGRVRSNRGCFFNFNSEMWCKVKEVFSEATEIPKLFGEVLLTKRNKFKCNLVTYKNDSKGRKKKNKKGTVAKGTYHSVQSKSAKEPWVLATSLQPEENLALNAVNFYSKRMQIEEEFRDTKSKKFGFGLEESRTTIFKRVEVLLLINMLTSLKCWAFACWTVNNNKHRDYHSNSVKENTVLSAKTLAISVFRRITQLKMSEFKQGFKWFLELIFTENSYVNA